MGYQKFCHEFKQGVLSNTDWELAPEDYVFYADGFQADGDARVLEFIRNTNRKYHRQVSDVLQGGFVVLRCKVGEMAVDCRFSVEELFREYRKRGWEQVWEIVDANICFLHKFYARNLNTDIDDYEKSKSRLYIFPMNYTDNEYELRNAICKVCGDIALVLYAVMYDDERGCGAFQVDKKYLDIWKKTLEEVYDEGLLNTNLQALPRLYRTIEERFMQSLERGRFMYGEEDVTEISSTDIPILTTTKQENGAIAMFYPGVKEKIAELLGGSYYVYFLDRDEAVIQRVGETSPRKLLFDLENTNRMMDAQKILTRNIFLYDAKEKTFEALEL